ncbi:TolC family protein [Alteromonas sp. 14N.309.X.WAT.G.H12]|uniref:TolC family protein n=1 Tax=Alteromonas sp. 14N.309.X.WAT.G.H12 TaxID=3120824 RepID=UPI002FCFE43C
MKTCLGLLGTILLSGCAYTPADFSSKQSITVPEDLAPYEEEGHSVTLSDSWWTAFGSKPLAELMRTMERGNLTVQEAKLRVERARLLLEQSRADNYIGVTGSLGGASNEDLDSGSTSHSSSARLSVSYSFDVWGSRDATQLAASLDIDSQRYALRNAALQVQVLLATEYFNWLSLTQRYAIAQKNLDAAQRLLDLVNIRFEAGDASGIEVSQQHNTLIGAQAERLNLANQITISQRAISVLLGQNAFDVTLQAQPLEQIVLPDIPLYQPAKVIASRPDVQLADVALRQADISVYQAGIEGLPGLSLSADVTLSDILDLASGWSLGAAVNSAITLFDGGRIDAGEKIANVDLQIAWNNYRATTLGATQALMDALSNYAYYKGVYQLDEASVINNEQLYRLAEIRYKAGDADFLNLLGAQRSWFQSQLTLISSYQQSLAAAAAVYQQAGGRPVVVR